MIDSNWFLGHWRYVRRCPLGQFANQIIEFLRNNRTLAATKIDKNHVSTTQIFLTVEGLVYEFRKSKRSKQNHVKIAKIRIPAEYVN